MANSRGGGLSSREAKEGGELKKLPCPFCQETEKTQRSDYIRCSRCGLNWLDGEDILTKSPIACNQEP